jgi:vacuolar-type H+-ATPase subunit I/STV1
VNDTNTLRNLEHRAYQRAYSDGIIDLFVGISLVWIGSAWMWLPDIAGLAGIFPAVFAPMVIATRKSFVENRAGYVRWSEPRRNREHRTLVLALIFGVLLFLAAMVAYFVFDHRLSNGDVTDSIAPAVLAWILAILSLLIAYLLDAWRFLAYTAVLAVGGLIAALESANPGAPLLAAGAVMTIAGTIMLVQFVRANPGAPAA